MSPCDSNSMTHAAGVSEGDFEGSERSMDIAGADRLHTEHGPTDGRVPVLESGSQVPELRVESVCMSAKTLCELFEREVIECKGPDCLSTFHFKATIRKVTSPIVFGHYTQSFRNLFEKHPVIFENNQVKPILGLGENIKKFPEEKRADTEANIEACSANRLPPVMDDSKKGITSVRAPGDVPIDGSIPAMIKGKGGVGGGTWCHDWKPANQDSTVCCTKAKSPDPGQAGLFVDVVEFRKKKGACNRATMGSVPSDEVMPQLVPEYGSHGDKTFEAPGAGRTSLAAPFTTLVIQTALTEDDVPACRPSMSMKRVSKSSDLLNPFMPKQSCVAGILFQ